MLKQLIERNKKAIMSLRDLVANINVELEDLSWHHRIEFTNHKENECKCDAIDIRVVSKRRTLGMKEVGLLGDHKSNHW